MAAQNTDGSRPVGLNDPNLHEGGYFIDQWVEREVEYRFIKGDSVLSLPLLDYYAFLNLMEKRLDNVDLLIRLYRLAEARTLPRYVQEALCLHTGYPHSVTRHELMQKKYHGYHLDENTAADVLNVYEAYRQLQQRHISFETVTHKYNSTYTYHYLFSVIR